MMMMKEILIREKKIREKTIQSGTLNLLLMQLKNHRKLMWVKQQGDMGSLENN